MAEMMNGEPSLGVVDRVTRSWGVALSRRRFFQGGLLGLVSVAGLGVLKPIAAGACSNCHYCVSGCTGNCQYFRCCSYGGTCQYCPPPPWQSCNGGIQYCLEYENYACDQIDCCWCNWATCVNC